jgi:hypothetical protein
MHGRIELTAVVSLGSLLPNTEIGLSVLGGES